MLKLTKKLEYGLLAVDYLANHDSDGCVNSREIAAEHGIPHELLAKVMQKLVRSGVVLSQHGPRGGYKLARGLSELTLVDLVEAVEGPIKIVDCEVTAPEACPQFSRCTIKDPIVRVQRNLQHFLSHITIAELVKQDLIQIERRR